VNVNPLDVVDGQVKNPVEEEYGQVAGSGVPTASNAAPANGEARETTVLTVAGDISASSAAMSGMLDVVGPVELYEHAVAARITVHSRIGERGIEAP